MIQILLLFARDVSVDTLEWLRNHANDLHARLSSYLGYAILWLLIGACFALAGPQWSWVNDVFILVVLVFSMVVGTHPDPVFWLGITGAGAGALTDTVLEGLTKILQGIFNAATWILLFYMFWNRVLASPLIDVRQYPRGLLTALVACIILGWLFWKYNWKGNWIRNTVFVVTLGMLLYEGIWPNLNIGKTESGKAANSLLGNDERTRDRIKAEQIRMIEKFYRRNRFYQQHHVNFLHRIGRPLPGYVVYYNPQDPNGLNVALTVEVARAKGISTQPQKPPHLRTATTTPKPQPAANGYRPLPVAMNGHSAPEAVRTEAPRQSATAKAIVHYPSNGWRGYSSQRYGFQKVFTAPEGGEYEYEISGEVCVRFFDPQTNQNVLSPPLGPEGWTEMLATTPPEIRQLYVAPGVAPAALLFRVEEGRPNCFAAGRKGRIRLRSGESVWSSVNRGRIPDDYIHNQGGFNITFRRLETQSA